MKNFTTYLFVMFMIMFWGFRILVAFFYNMGWEFVAEPLDLNFEILLLFVAFICVLLVIKRNMFGALLYLAGYWLYFGANLIRILQMFNEGIEMTVYIDFITSIFGILIPLLVLFDLILDKNAKAHPTDKKTDWFYKNKDYDRKFDERADRNEYKIW